ncbi:hypothetical protein RM545_09000 [Zunongwangia sp. F260]|uniref:Uncharacterized protein n=1 Tax=Autumnicola lenta TaxID=3075593 RepID=A0ABU3CKS0_9FLAO|nr:hypothetical protein [Zunongwangia sp. F260]MDT0646827.1 hypothetical protein [Zunongwangia sp. F260]
MKTLDNIRNRLIDKILISRDEELLFAIDKIFDSAQSDEKLHLNSEQIELLLMSEKDIEEGKVISEDDLEKLDSEWMS